MKKFEFDFINQWKFEHGQFDFIRFGVGGFEDWVSVDIAILGFSFTVDWNSDDAIAEDKMWQEFINKINEKGIPCADEPEAKKAVKKVAKKAVKKAKKTKKSK